MVIYLKWKNKQSHTLRDTLEGVLSVVSGYPEAQVFPSL